MNALSDIKDFRQVNKKLTYTSKFLKIIFDMWTLMVNGYHSAKMSLGLAKSKHAFFNLNLGIIPPQINHQKTKQQSPKQRLKIAWEQLDNQQNPETSLTAIYDLEQIAHDYSQCHWTIIEHLTMFVRNNARNLSLEEVKNNPSPKIRPDIQAALTVIARRDSKKDPENEQLDLSHTDMRGANLCGANLEKANLYQSNLSQADMSGANLDGAILTAVNLKGANLEGTNLQGTILTAANLDGANLSHANLYRANLYLATLYGASVNHTIFNGANLREAKFSAVD